MALERCNALRERPRIYIDSPVWLREKEGVLLTDEKAVITPAPAVSDPFLNRVADGSSGRYSPEGKESEGGPFLLDEEEQQSPYKKVGEMLKRVRSADSEPS